jgi:hypothetical protein
MHSKQHTQVIRDEVFDHLATVGDVPCHDLLDEDSRDIAQRLQINVTYFNDDALVNRWDRLAR